MKEAVESVDAGRAWVDAVEDVEAPTWRGIVEVFETEEQMTDPEAAGQFYKVSVTGLAEIEAGDKPYEVQHEASNFDADPIGTEIW